MIGKILKSGSFASKVDYVTREKHDHRIYTPDTWKILGSKDRKSVVEGKSVG